MIPTHASSRWRLLLVLLTAFGSAHAATVDPFIARVEVPDRSDAARRAGQQEALEQVLVKLTGHPAAPRQINAAISDAHVQQFRYLESPVTAEQPGRIELEVRFAPAPIRAMVSDAGLPLWPLERGETAVWIAMEEGGRRVLLGTEPQHDPLREAVTVAAERHGMPVVMPLMDLEDQAAVTTAEIWGGFSDRVRAANERYAAPYMLVGRLEPSGSGWRGRWVLDIDRGTERWESSGATAEEVIAGGVSGAAERLAERFAVGTGPQLTPGDGVQIRVIGVTTPRAYGRLIQYLESLSIVRQVAVERVQGNALDIRLEMDGDQRALARLFEIDRVLAADAAGYPQAEKPVYRLDELSMQ